jgi:hypothetical protein
MAKGKASARVKAKGRKASGGRARAAARAGRPVAGKTRAAAGDRVAAAPPSYDEGKEYTSLRDVAARADRDPDFFQAVIDNRTSLTDVLRRYGFELSNKDAAFLNKGLKTVEHVREDFAMAIGGWGRWPR